MTKSRGFTIAELLVAVAITSVLVVLLISVVSATMTVWQQARNRIDTLSEARQMLTRMADEIRGAMARGGQIEFSENLIAQEFISGGQSPTPNPQPTPQNVISENIFFVAPYPNSGSGDLCVIAYRHIDADQNPIPNNAHTLQRAFIDSQTAWISGGANRYRSTGYNVFDWRTVARGVLEFEVRSYSQADLDNATQYGRPPGNTAAPAWNSEGVDPVMSGNAPRRVVLRLKILDDKALARLTAVPATGPAHDRIVLQSAHEFTADITLPAPH